LLSSISETFSVAVLEYMRAGLPVLATRIGSIEDEVLDGQTGLLVERHDKEGYARALALLVGDSDLRQRLGCAGRALQAQEFTSRHMSREYLNLFAHRVSALNSHPSR
jgi:glycosyltransferase involved in cell wall biosynthesis